MSVLRLNFQPVLGLAGCLPRTLASCCILVLISQSGIVSPSPEVMIGVRTALAHPPSPASLVGEAAPILRPGQPVSRSDRAEHRPRLLHKGRRSASTHQHRRHPPADEFSRSENNCFRPPNFALCEHLLTSSRLISAIRNKQTLVD